MKVAAPGKVILSGEHAVVYGKPALVIAVNRFVYTTITPAKRPGILFDFADLNHRAQISDAVLRVLKAQLKRQYKRFKSGDVSIKRVLKKPFQLAQFAFSTVIDTFNLSLPHGIKIHISSTIPIGCGMGSSAATIVSVMYGISQYLQRPIENDELFKLALDAENLQHGASSGIDLRVALQGGCLYFENNQSHRREFPDWPIHLVNTGAPASSTGQCVAHAATVLKDSTLLNDFANVTEKMDQAVQQQNRAQFSEAIRDNQRLLIALGVVSKSAQRFSTELENAGGSAKISGAGTVTDDACGIMLVEMEDEALLKELCQRYGYEMLAIKPEPKGVRCEKV